MRQSEFVPLDDLIQEILQGDDFPWQCIVCGCSDFDSCPGGCGWSEYFANLGAAVCTRCEPVMACMGANMRALDLWRSQKLQEQPHAR